MKRRHNHDKVNPKVNNGESRSSLQNVSMYCQQFFCHILLSWQLILLFLSLVCISGSVRGDWWWMKTTKQLSRKLFLPTLRFSQEILEANCIVYCRKPKYLSFRKIVSFCDILLNMYHIGPGLDDMLVNCLAWVSKLESS